MPVYRRTPSGFPSDWAYELPTWGMHRSSLHTGISYTSSDWLSKAPRAKPGFTPAIGPAVECLNEVTVAWCAVGVIKSLVIRHRLPFMHLHVPRPRGWTQRPCKPHIRVTLLAEWSTASMAFHVLLERMLSGYDGEPFLGSVNVRSPSPARRRRGCEIKSELRTPV